MVVPPPEEHLRQTGHVVTMKVYVFPADTTGCGCYRLIWPAEALAKIGCDVEVVHSAAEFLQAEILGGYRKSNGQMAGGRVQRVIIPPDTDVIVLQRPMSRYLAEAVPLLRDQGVTVVVEMDDDLETVHHRHPMRAKFDPAHNPEFNWDHAQKACDQATLVTATTRPLLAKYARTSPGILIPNYAPDHLLHIPHTDSGQIGWGGSVFTHPDDPAVIGDALARLFTTAGQQLKIVGPGPADAVGREFGVKARQVSVTGPIPIEDYAATVAAQIGVGIAPLQHSIFNSSKCMDASTRVTTSDGVLKASEIREGMQVWNNGRWVPVEAVDHQLPRPGLLLTTENGLTLKLTPEHRMMVNSEWTQAGYIRVGDEIHMQPEAVGPAAYQVVPWPAENRMSRKADADHYAFMTAPDGPHLTITPRWGRFLGAYAGDGSVGGTGTQVVISCDGIDQDWIDMVSADFRAFGLSAGTEKVTTYDGKLIRRRHVLSSSAHLLRVMEQMGVVRRRENGKYIRVACVPEVIWRSPRDVIAEFLAGYFEADGTATKSIVAVSKDRHLIRDVQRLLLLFGIESFISEKTNRAQNGFVGKYWNLRLRRASADLFEKEIGFRSARKRASLAQITSKRHSNAFKPHTWKTAVASIERCMVEPVDIQVEGEVFALAGFTSHNSWLKPLEYSALGIPWVASGLDEYRAFFAATGAGLIAESPKQWYQHLRRLTRSRVMRLELGERGRQTVREGFTISGNAAQWWDAWAYAYQLQSAQVGVG